MLPIASNEREFEVPGFVGECISCGPQALRNADRKGILILPIVVVVLIVIAAIASAF